MVFALVMPLLEVRLEVVIVVAKVLYISSDRSHFLGSWAA